MLKRGLSVITLGAVMLLCAAGAHAGHLHPERVYQARWCDAAGGVVEFVLPDRSRVDCLTGEYAVEVDFAAKWAEAVGQSLFYSIMSRKRPGIVLIMESGKDERFLKRLIPVADKAGIRVWTIYPGDVEGRGVKEE